MITRHRGPGLGKHYSIGLATGLEPVTCSLQMNCSCHLSYTSERAGRGNRTPNIDLEDRGNTILQHPLGSVLSKSGQVESNHDLAPVHRDGSAIELMPTLAPSGLRLDRATTCRPYSCLMSAGQLGNPPVEATGLEPAA